MKNIFTFTVFTQLIVTTFAMPVFAKSDTCIVKVMKAPATFLIDSEKQDQTYKQYSLSFPVNEDVVGIDFAQKFHKKTIEFKLGEQKKWVSVEWVVGWKNISSNTVALDLNAQRLLRVVVETEDQDGQRYREISNNISKSKDLSLMVLQGTPSSRSSAWIQCQYDVE